MSIPLGKVGSRSMGAFTLTEGTPVNAAAAQGTLTVGAQVTADDTMTIDTTVYTFVANGTTPLAAGQIEMGSDVAGTRTNIIAALKGTDHNDAHPSVTPADTFSTADLTLTYNIKGVVGNSIATTETFNSASNEFDAATLGTTTAGVDGTVGRKGELMFDDTNIYFATEANNTEGANWRKIAHTALS